MGRHLSALHASVRSLSAGLDAAAPRAQLEAARGEAAARLAAALDRVEEERAGRGMVEQLSATSDALSAQLSALAGMLHTKVDRAEIVRIQATGSELASFAAWKAGATATIAELDARTSSSRAALDRSLESTVKLSATVQALAGTAAAKADAVAVAGLADAVDRLAADVGTRATSAELRDVRTALAAVAGRASVLEGGAKDAARGAAEDRRTAESRVAAAASALRSELAAVREGAAREASRLQEEVDARAYVTAVEATDEGAASLRGEVATLGRRVDVAMRFVDWYAAKGEGYEANAGALERHMNALAVSNRAVTRGSGGDADGRPLGPAYLPWTKEGGADAAHCATAGGSPGGPRVTGSQGVRIGGLARGPVAFP